MLDTALILIAHFAFQTLGAQFAVERTLTSSLNPSIPPGTLFSLVVIFALTVLVVLTVSDTPAFAEEARPGWEVTSTTFPTHLAPGGTGTLEVNVYNVGAAGSSGPVTVTDALPAGVVATRAGDLQFSIQNNIGENGLWDCSTGHVVTCISNQEKLSSLPWIFPITEQNDTFGELAQGTILHIAIEVEVDATTPQETLTNDVTVAGGGALAPASTSAPIVVSSTPASTFGFAASGGWFSNPNGTVDTQAGSHPYEFTYRFALNTREGHYNPALPLAEGLEPVGGQARDLAVNLPPGFIGNPTAVPQCTRQQFEEEDCEPATQVGLDTPDIFPNKASRTTIPYYVMLPVYNLVPPPGVPAQFAFTLYGIRTYIDVGVRSGGDYGLTIHVNNIAQVHTMGNSITFWGEPSDPFHNNERVTNYYGASSGKVGTCLNGCVTSAPRIPFLTVPTSCKGPQTFSESLDTWETAGFGELSYKSSDQNDTPTGFTGCDRLGFGPTISAAPDTTDADTPAGLTVDVKVPQEGLSLGGALATSNIKDTTVVLPKGVVINPGQAAGLQACQQGPTEPSPSGEPAHPGRDNLPLEGENGEEQKFEGPADCPNASKVGTVEIETPLLKHSLKGDVYVLQSNPPNLKLLMTAEGEGVFLKLVNDVSLCENAGEVLDGKTCEAAGQLIGRLSETPELPFTDFKLSFSGGAQAALDTPTTCTIYSSSADFTPWSSPVVADAFPSSAFAITAGVGGGGCPPSPLPFAPSLTAGATTDQAGGFTDFSLLLQRPDDQQRIAGLQFKAPPGLTGELSKVPLCTNVQAEANECPEASEIGHTVVEAGPGPYPLVVPEPGQEQAPMYLTGPYNGSGACTVGEPGCAPFGLSIVVPLHVGPFTLPTQRVRAKIEVDPHTAQLTVTTGPLPQEVAGVPTDVREIDAVVDHPEFIINPTNCDPSSFSGTATGAPPPGSGGNNTTAAISSPFSVGSCRSLGFSPSLAASSSGKTSKARGASLSATLSYPATPAGTGQATDQANIHTVKVELPKQLPSRLTTLQKACTAAQFNLNPAGCPTASNVGQAVVHTPVLPVPLVGPAYFVSHGGEAFPALVVVLQGYGVEIIVEATTFISKTSVTSLTFKAAPDAPFSSFTLSSPEGPDSILTANGDLCTSKLTMPTELVAQDGAVLHETTKVSVTGCPKIKPLTRAQKLTKALKACHKDKRKTKRANCERAAHKKYGPTKAKKTKKKKK